MKKFYSLPFLLLTVAASWRFIYGYWTPIVDRYLVPPGNDAAFHIDRVSDILGGSINLFYQGYPLGFHWLIAILAKLFGLSALSAIYWLAPALLILPIFTLFWIGNKMFKSPIAGASASLTWALLSLASIRTFGDGTYPNLLVASNLVPFAIAAMYFFILKPSRQLALNFISLTFLIALMHHLSLIYLLVVILPWLFIVVLYQLFQPGNHGKLLKSIGTILIFAVALGIGLWPYYGPSLIEPYYQALISRGSLADLLGMFSAPISINGLLEIHGVIFVILGLLGFALMLVSRLSWSIKILFAFWLGILTLFSLTDVFGLPGRFARELAIPLALAIGYFVHFILHEFQNRPIKYLSIIGLIIIVLFDWGLSFNRPFALPDPFKPLNRVQHDEEPGITILNNSTSGLIIANNSNPYLPYLANRPVEIISNPDQVASLVTQNPKATIFVGARPPLTPESIYPYYANFDDIKQSLEALPNLELVARLPSGTVIYQLGLKSDEVTK